MADTKTNETRNREVNSLYWGISWGDVPQRKLFILNKVHLSYDVNYTNHENGLKNAHLDRTIGRVLDIMLSIDQEKYRSSNTSIYYYL